MLPCRVCCCAMNKTKVDPDPVVHSVCTVMSTWSHFIHRNMVCATAV